MDLEQRKNKEFAIFKNIFIDLFNNGFIVKSRIGKTIEIINKHIIFLPYQRFCNFDCRKLSIKYIKEEIKWYLSADNSNKSILKHAKIWRDIAKKGKINSNYGEYIFKRNSIGIPIDYVVSTLKNDINSRRSIINLNFPRHNYMSNPDVPCTMYLSFLIRNNRLLLSVQMRSQDAIFGLCNDLPFFSIIQEMVFNLLLDKYKNLKMGELSIFVNSFHLYERHFDMMKNIVNSKINNFNLIAIPKMIPEEVKKLKNNIYDDYDFTNWLNS